MTLCYGGLRTSTRAWENQSLQKPPGLEELKIQEAAERSGRGKYILISACSDFVCHLLDFILKMKFKAHVGGLMNWNVCLLAFPKGEKTSTSELGGRVFALLENIIKTHVELRPPRVWPNCCECMGPLTLVSSQWPAWFCPLSAREGVPSPPSRSLTRTTWWNPLRKAQIVSGCNAIKIQTSLVK